MCHMKTFFEGGGGVEGLNMLFSFEHPKHVTLMDKKIVTFLRTKYLLKILTHLFL